MATASDDLALARWKHQSGDLPAAIQLYHKVVASHPARADAVTLLALACHEKGDLVEAERWYRQALLLQPDNAETRFRFGLALVNLKRPEDAAVQFREVVRLRPDAPEPWNNLGNVLFVQEKHQEAIACYQEAVRLRPDFAEACLNLGKALREDDQVMEGLAWYREAVRLRPTYARAQNDLAVALLEMGELKEAEGHFRECLRHNPGSPRVLCTLAAHGLYAPADPRPDELLAMLNDPNLSPMDVSLIHSTAGYLFERAGDYDRAFPHFCEGNRLRREQLRQEGTVFDPGVHRKFIDQLIAIFTPAYFERVRSFGLDTEVPILIVGMPRSGSSLVEQILSQHPEVAGVGELRDFIRLVETLPQRIGAGEPYPECVNRLSQTVAREIGQTYLDRLERLVGTASRVTDKMLDNFLHLGLIATLFPRARVIHCVREPLDVCVSCYLQIFRGLHFTRDLGDLGAYYKEYERLMKYWRSVLPLTMFDVVYEDLVADPETESRRLVEFCGLGWDERCLRFHENPRAVRTVSKLQVRRPVYSSSVGRWQRYAAHLGPLREALGLANEANAGPRPNN